MICNAYPQGILYCIQGVYAIHKTCTARRIYKAYLKGLQGIYVGRARHICKTVHFSTYMPCSTCAPGRHMSCSTCAPRHMLVCTAPHMPCSTFSHGICGCAARHKIVLHGICEVTLTRIVQKLPLMPWRNDICRVGVE